MTVKKLLSLFLVLFMLLSICACADNEAQNTDSGSDLGHDTAENTDESTNSTVDDGNVSKDSSTTSSPSADVGDSSKTTESDKDKPDSQIKPITPPTYDSPTVPDENTQTPTDKPDDNTTNEPSDCEHTYTTASCSMPKICTKCRHIAGHSLPHNYNNGVCTVCGKPEIAFNIKEGDWVANIVKDGTADQGEVLSQYILTQNQFVYSTCFTNPLACILNLGKVIYNEKTYYADYYYLAFSSVDCEDSGDTITVTSRAGSGLEIVLTKISETKLKVISSNDKAYIPVGTVLVKQ